MKKFPSGKSGRDFFQSLAEFARMRESIQIRFSGDMCGGKTP